MKTKVYIRVDWSAKIGLGHLVRCMALAEMIKAEFDVYFVNKDISENVKVDLEKEGYKQVIIQQEGDFFKLIEKNDIVVLDHYDLDTHYQRKVKDRHCKLVCIDDLHDKEFYADLVINHIPGIRPENYRAQAYTRFALGLDYALLRAAFLSNRKLKRNIEKIETVLICFGGTDSLNLTQRVLEIILRYGRFHKIIVITGVAYRYQPHLELIARREKNVELRHSINANEVQQLMSESELAIVPASGTLIEALSTGCRIISGMYIENQKFLFSAFRDLELITSAENFSTKGLKNALVKISQLSRPEQIIDGLSGVRILKYFLQLSSEGNCNLRVATKKDLYQTYKWAIDSKIRVFSFNKSEIKFQQHEKWFLSKLKDLYCYYLIFEFKGEAAGSIRFDKNENRIIISYLLDPEFHGRGLGTILLKMGLEWLSFKDKGISEIIGDVMNTNIPSIKAFENLFFTRTSLNQTTIRFKKDINEYRE